MATKHITKIGVLSLGKVCGAIYGIIGIIFGALTTLASLGTGSIMGHEGVFASLLFGVGAIITVPILYGFLGFIGGIIVALVYNAAAGFIGGLEIEVEYTRRFAGRKHFLFSLGVIVGLHSSFVKPFAFKWHHQHPV